MLLSDFEHEAIALLDALNAGDEEAAWQFKWLHGAFRDAGIEAVRAATLGPDDARLVIAHEHAFETWNDLVAFTEATAADGDAARFERAADAVVAGDMDTLREMLRTHPELASARSPRRHRATLLHYVAANGVEGNRQQTPANILDVAALLLDAGSDPDALATMYDAECTTMSMLVSSAHPAAAGVQESLAELLVDRGAAFDGAGTKWQSALMTALAFGYPRTAATLAARGARIDNVVAAAGLGLLGDVERLLPESDAESRHAALALAAQHGFTDVVRALLDAGEDPDRYNPDGFHGHSTPMHQAALGDHTDVVRLLVERGARLDVRDTLFDGTPHGWAVYGEQPEVTAYFESVGAPR